ncbi:MAG: prepilin-type N-terminal cleavage/methylation domain-containing protein [Gammaproteobacteria bacterium]|nr:prepilin-type N-terminal cleavage/methylation domain-containing protein [Gammaproteobacteria bacterium]
MHRKSNRLKLSFQSGFSLIELAITIIVLGLVVAAISGFMGRSILGFSRSVENISALTKMRYIDQRLAKELRLVNYNAGAYVLTANTTATKFEYTDISGANDVVISYNGTDTLNISYTNPATNGDLSREMSAFSFNYYTSDGVTAAAVDGSDLVFVEYSFTITENNATYSTSSRVMLRDNN